MIRMPVMDNAQLFCMMPWACKSGHFEPDRDKGFTQEVFCHMCVIPSHRSLLTNPHQTTAASPQTSASNIHIHQEQSSSLLWTDFLPSALNDHTLGLAWTPTPSRITSNHKECVWFACKIRVDHRNCADTPDPCMLFNISPPAAQLYSCTASVGQWVSVQQHFCQLSQLRSKSDAIPV